MLYVKKLRVSALSLSSSAAPIYLYNKTHDWSVVDESLRPAYGEALNLQHGFKSDKIFHKMHIKHLYVRFLFPFSLESSSLSISVCLCCVCCYPLATCIYTHNDSSRLLANYVPICIYALVNFSNRPISLTIHRHRVALVVS